jgi:hypothetical protein
MEVELLIHENEKSYRYRYLHTQMFVTVSFVSKSKNKMLWNRGISEVNHGTTKF